MFNKKGMESSNKDFKAFYFRRTMHGGTRSGPNAKPSKVREIMEYVNRTLFTARMKPGKKAFVVKRQKFTKKHATVQKK